MADISQEIAAFQSAKYGEQVRSSMVSLAEKINDEVDQASGNIEGFGITIGTVETVAPDQTAEVTVTGTQYAPVLNFKIPRGADGGVAGDISQNAVNFTEASERTALTTGQSLAIGFGKIKKWFSDLRGAAFSEVENSLTETDAGSVLDARQGKYINDNFVHNTDLDWTELTGVTLPVMLAGPSSNYTTVVSSSQTIMTAKEVLIFVGSRGLHFFNLGGTEIQGGNFVLDTGTANALSSGYATFYDVRVDFSTGKIDGRQTVKKSNASTAQVTAIYYR